MSEWLTYLLAITAGILVTAPIGVVLWHAMKAKNEAMDYLTRRAMDSPPPPPRPKDFATAATYFEAAAAWDKRFTAHCAKYP